MQRIFVKVDGFILSLDHLFLSLNDLKISFFNNDMELTSWIFEYKASAESVFDLLWSMISHVVQCDNDTTLDFNTYDINEKLNDAHVVKIKGPYFESKD